jgi:S1-C subfamily serine protease
MMASSERHEIPVESNVGRLANAVLAAAFIALVSASAASAQSVESLVSAVVKINTHINPDGRTVQSLGHEREGSGIVIDSAGLVLTIGYLMVEAYAAAVVDNNGRTVPADVVGYDHESGFGLLRAIEPLKLKPMALGKSAEIKEGDPVLLPLRGGGPSHKTQRRTGSGRSTTERSSPLTLGDSVTRSNGRSFRHTHLAEIDACPCRKLDSDRNGGEIHLHS